MHCGTMLVKGVDYMKNSNYSIRIDPETKTKAEETFAKFGLNLSEAITVFLHMSIMKNGFPFELTYHKPNEMLKASFKEAEALLANPNLRGYATIEELNAAMDAEDSMDSEYT